MSTAASSVFLSSMYVASLPTWIHVQLYNTCTWCFLHLVFFSTWSKLESLRINYHLPVVSTCTVHANTCMLYLKF